jgi:ribosomal protein S18 acetylase RimI-like enzyme
MVTKVIQGSFVRGQPKSSPSIQPKITPSSIQVNTAKGLPAIAFASHPPGVPPSIAIAARPPARPPVAFAARRSGPPVPAFAGQPAAVQRHNTGGAFAVDAGPLGLASGGGKSLPEAVRGKMEAALRADFSNVRVHVGPQAERIGAIAFTTGNDIYFAPGRYQPDTIQGQQLLGHELAHVVQQRAGRVRNRLSSGLAVVQDHALEAEADRLGRRAAAPALPSRNVERSAPKNFRLTNLPGRVRIDALGKDQLAPIAGLELRQATSTTVELCNLRVAEPYRRQHFGSALVRKAIETARSNGARRVILEVRPGDRAVSANMLESMYQKLGFRPLGRSPAGNTVMQRATAVGALPPPETGKRWKHTTPRTVQKMDAAPFSGPNPVANVGLRMDWFTRTRGLPKEYLGEEDPTGSWGGGHQELANAHHKFPKRTLGWLWDHMTEGQQERLRKKLFLQKTSGSNALKRLRSNLIPPGPNNVRSDTRLDDPEHTKEFLDLVVIADTGRLTPRSSTYLQLAYLYETIYQELVTTSSAFMSDIQASKMTDLLFQAEQWHFEIEGDTQSLANYGNYWVEVEEGKESIPTASIFKERNTLVGRKWIKGVSRQKIPEKLSREGEFLAYLERRKKEANEEIKEAIANHPMTWEKWKRNVWVPENEFDDWDAEDEYFEYVREWHQKHQK